MFYRFAPTLDENELGNFPHYVNAVQTFSKCHMSNFLMYAFCSARENNTNSYVQIAFIFAYFQII